tara:strand:+ start:1126 stop:1884 length:759 start_codon:yes stop_codon:yes gene_type:complete
MTNTKIDYKKLARLYSNGKVKKSEKHELQKRINSYVEDEPLTIQWIESFNENSVFYDIGSNIGGFSIITSLIHDDIQIYSFEPNYMNFNCQIETCRDNNFSNIFPMNLAINNTNEFNIFKYDKLNVGSKGTFGDELKEQMLKSQYSNPFKRGISHEIGILGVSLDSLVYEFGIPAPDYIKLDIDGNDLLALQGAKKLLQDGNKVKELYIEIDDKIYGDNEIDNLMKNHNFKVVKNDNVGSKSKPMRMVLYKR